MPEAASECDELCCGTPDGLSFCDLPRDHAKPEEGLHSCEYCRTHTEAEAEAENERAERERGT